MLKKKQWLQLLKLLVLLLTSVFILSTCKLSETETNNQPVDSGFYLIGTQVIGSAGGEINLDSIIVKVPSGAFDENNEINIYVSEENDGFDEYGSSALYQLDGLPSTINKPIKFSLQYHGTIEGDTLVAIGEMGYAVSLDSSLFAYHTESATDSAGYLVYELRTNSNLAKMNFSKIENNNEEINIVALTDYTNSFSANRLFEISYPRIYEQYAIKVGEHFENSYNKCKSMGLDPTARDWVDSPASVMIKQLDYDGGYRAGQEEFEIESDDELRGLINQGKFEINWGLLNLDLKLKTTIGHEFLHLIQNLYEFSSTSRIEDEQGWLEEATAVWIQEKYVDNSSYYPTDYNEREYYPFDGWQFGGRPVEDKYAEQGYGLSMLIKRLVWHFGEGVIVDIFDAVKAGTLPSNATDPVDAVLSVINHPVEVFWFNTLSWYTLGEAYNKQVNFKFLNNSNNYKGTVLIDPTFTTQSFKLGYHDLSGKLFKVQAGDISTLTKLPLSFSVDDIENCGILVCKFKQGSKEITTIGEVFPGNDGIVTIDDVKPIFDEGYELVVMVSNGSHNKNSNYQNSHDIELIIDRPVEINGRIDFNIECKGTYLENTNLYWNSIGVDTSYYLIDNPAKITNFDPNLNPNISISGNVVTLISDITDHVGRIIQLFLVLEFDDIKNPSLINSFNCSRVLVYQDANTDERTEERMSGQNIPLVNDVSSSPLRFRLDGNVVANLTDVQYEFTMENRLFNPTGYSNTTLTSFDATTGQIRFEIYFEEE